MELKHKWITSFSGEDIDPKYYSENNGNLNDGKRGSCDLVRGSQSIILNLTQQFFIWRVEIIIKKFDNSEEEEGKQVQVIHSEPTDFTLRAI